MKLSEFTDHDWHGKPYYSLDAYCKNTYGEKLYKIAINAGLSCPNRDGSLGVGGCVFCSRGGSGDFAIKQSEFPSIVDQLAAGKELFHHKRTGERFIAYFQAYTNTYGPLPYLEEIFTQALSDSAVAGISIATRPDCMGENIVTMLVNLTKKFPDKFVWIELGLQTIHESTAKFIRRGYPLKVYDDCVIRLSRAGIPVITHIIIGLPGETEKMLQQTIDHINKHPVFGIKLQLLHVLKDTDLADYYEEGHFEALSYEEYEHLLFSCIRQLSPKIVIHRITGDGPKDQLIAPLWSLNKRNVLNSLHHSMKNCRLYQGEDYNA